MCYGGDERTSEGMESIQGFDSGFKRWAYKSVLNMSNPLHGTIFVVAKADDSALVPKKTFVFDRGAENFSRVYGLLDAELCGRLTAL